MKQVGRKCFEHNSDVSIGVKYSQRFLSCVPSVYDALAFAQLTLFGSTAAQYFSPFRVVQRIRENSIPLLCHLDTANTAPANHATSYHCWFCHKEFSKKRIFNTSFEHLAVKISPKLQHHMKKRTELSDFGSKSDNRKFHFIGPLSAS